MPMNNENDRAAPLVSVCVVTYQHKDFIRQCLDSILSQRVNFSYEIIIGEDGSTDGTREICQQYAEHYPDKVRLFLRSRSEVIYINGRPSGRFNFIESYKATRGTYIALCEGDDYWTNNDKLQKQVTFLETNPDFTLTHTNVDHVDKVGNVTLPAPLHYKEVMTHDEVAGQITVQTLTMVFRRSALASFPPEYYKIFNADVFIVALLSEKGKVKFFTEVMGAYRKHGGGTFTGIDFMQKQSNKLDSLTALLHHFPSPKVKSGLRNSISRTYGRILYTLLSSHQYADFFRFLKKTIYFDITNFRFSFSHLVNHAIKKVKQK